MRMYIKGTIFVLGFSNTQCALSLHENSQHLPYIILGWNKIVALCVMCPVSGPSHRSSPRASSLSEEILRLAHKIATKAGDKNPRVMRPGTPFYRASMQVVSSSMEK